MTETTRPEGSQPSPAQGQPSPPAPGQTMTEEQVQAMQNAPQRAEQAANSDAAQRGEPSAARTDPNNEPETGPGGMTLGTNADGTARREIAGGGHIEEHSPNVVGPENRDPFYFHRRYMQSRLRKEAGDVIARAPENIGFWGKGDTYRGNGGILIDIDTMEKHRFPDGYRFEGDEVYANSRDMPHALVQGDLTKNLSGA